jgi:hypothetical protein
MLKSEGGGRDRELTTDYADGTDHQRRFADWLPYRNILMR